MSSDGNDTQPGWPHRQSSRPRADISELPEPLIEREPAPTREYVHELHRDVRQLRNELHPMRDALWTVQHNVVRVDAAVAGLRTVVDEALRKQRRQAQIQLWVSVLATIMISATFLLILLRSYRLIGV